MGGVLYAMIGFFGGALFTLIALVGGLANKEGASEMGTFAGLFGTLAIVIFPIFYGVMGAIFSALSAVFYNPAAMLVGGLEVETE